MRRITDGNSGTSLFFGNSQRREYDQGRRTASHFPAFSVKADEGTGNGAWEKTLCPQQLQHTSDRRRNAFKKKGRGFAGDGR